MAFNQLCRVGTAHHPDFSYFKIIYPTVGCVSDSVTHQIGNARSPAPCRFRVSTGHRLDFSYCVFDKYDERLLSLDGLVDSGILPLT